MLSIFPFTIFSQPNDSYEFNNRFAIDFYRKVVTTSKGNVFFSPVSLSCAMSMAYAGTKNETEKQISAVFHFPANNTGFHKKMGSLSRNLKSKNKGVEINMVNRLWLENTFNIRRSYSKLMKSAYKSPISMVDFISKYEQSRLQINDYILKQTHEKIKDILPPNSVDNQTRLIITNAIYFKGQWEMQFDKKRTRENEFYTSPDTKVRCQMMGIKDKFNYYEDQKIKAVELFYADERYSLMILLPLESVVVSEVEKEITTERIKKITGAMNREEVIISIPKFRISAGYQLRKMLSEMGMPVAFSLNADLSGINGKNDLKITDVFHQAFVEVNEEGTEAAAATAVVVGIKSISLSKEFNANRPFIFFIMDKKTDAILFMGKLSNPAE